MKWLEFKNYVESLGVKDDTLISHRDMNFGGVDSEFDEGDFNLEDSVLLVSSPFFTELVD